MTAPVFVDTNVIVYRFDTTDPRKQPRAVDWFTLLWDRRSGRVSFQVLQEACAVLTRKLKPAMASGGRTARAPGVLDLSENGSAIPLEAARLGCEIRALDASSRTPRMNEGSGGQAGCA